MKQNGYGRHSQLGEKRKQNRGSVISVTWICMQNR
jgi:hypothetical protein